VAVPIFGMGTLQMFSRTDERPAMGIVGVLSSAALILLPTALIGVCALRTPSAT
jgi:hypothetical protein